MITYEQEVPLPEMPADPAFRENFCFEGYDHERDIGYFIHIGRWSLDPTIWREQVQIYLPDGTYLVRRSWGQSDISKGPAGALLKLTCEEAGKRWRVRYRGPARRVTAAELLDGPLGERPQLLIDLDATFESEHEIWEMGSATAEKQMWAHWHIEQPGTVKGRFEMNGEVTPIDGVGYRDHSRGPRKLTGLFDECWVHALFPSGRAFAVFHIRQQTGDGPITSAMAEAVIWDKGKLYPAVCKIPPLLGDTDYPLTAPPEHFTIDLESEIGPMHIEAEVRRALPHSTTEHGEWLDGIVMSDKSLAHLVTNERPTVFRWNGELGGGHTEQARRLR